MWEGKDKRKGGKMNERKNGQYERQETRTKNKRKIRGTERGKVMRKMKMLGTSHNRED